MQDAMLEGKFSAMSDPVIGVENTKALMAACWNLGQTPDVRTLTALARP
jgi:hypothetical protein